VGRMSLAGVVLVVLAALAVAVIFGQIFLGL
jgi:hypothetical protein